MKVYIEGNIACGKSTLTRMLSTRFKNCNFIQEPVDEWMSIKDDNDVNLLDHFYKDTKKWAFPFQMTTFITRVQKISNLPENETSFIERSVFTDRYCFAENLYETGYLNEIEWKLYTDWFAWLGNTFQFTPDLYIYLKTTPETCFTRLKKRSRNEETGVSLEYLTQLHQRHEKWLNNGVSEKVITIDANIEFETDLKRFDDIVERISHTIR